MKIVIYSAKAYEKAHFEAVNTQHTLYFVSDRLSLKTIEKANHAQAVCCFVTDCIDSEVINRLVEKGIQLIALRSAGYDHVDMTHARKVGITVVRVPRYSPEAIAEFAVGLILVLSRKILKAYKQGLEYNFTLDGLIGFNLYNKTVGIIGTGNIGTAFAKIMAGFGCRLLAVDPVPNDVCRGLNTQYVTLEYLLSESDIISLHCSLNNKTFHLIDKNAFSHMKSGAMLINTGRGGLCDTSALINAIENGTLGYAGLDVYEKEQDLFFVNHQEAIIQDTQFLKLQSLPNVIITPHQAFLTEEAVNSIAKITLENITAFEKGNPINQVS